MLLVKLLLTPLIIAAVTLIGRRWGPRAAGLVVGLPVTTGPVSAFLASERGPAFAVRAANGAVAGLVGTGVFCAAFAVVARRRDWPAAVLGGAVTLAAITLLLQATSLALPVAAGLAIATLVLLWAAVTRATADVAPHVADQVPDGTPRGPAPAWDLPVRIVISTGIVAAITTTAGALGSRWSGVLSALPVFATVLGAFTLRHDGRGAAIALMRGLIIGCVSGVLFFDVLGAVLAPRHLAASYGLATLTAIVSGAIISHVTRPRARVVDAEDAVLVRRAA